VEKEEGRKGGRGEWGSFLLHAAAYAQCHQYQWTQSHILPPFPPLLPVTRAPGTLARAWSSSSPRCSASAATAYILHSQLVPRTLHPRPFHCALLLLLFPAYLSVSRSCRCDVCCAVRGRAVARDDGLVEMILLFACLPVRVFLRPWLGKRGKNEDAQGSRRPLVQLRHTLQLRSWCRIVLPRAARGCRA
jgi:hypothetical protein